MLNRFTSTWIIAAFLFALLFVASFFPESSSSVVTQQKNASIPYEIDSTYKAASSGGTEEEITRK